MPWKPVIEQRLRKAITAIIRGSNVSWVLERQRGISMG
ncbi:MAG: DUF3363 domain-containing protein [Burkholderiaceae bacterium]